MSRTQPQATTLPFSTHRNQNSAHSVLRLRWVYPEARAITLDRRIIVGRDASCDEPLAGKQISRKHAEFRVDGPLCALFDLKSRNGVFVNGKRHDAGPAKIGDVVRCGEWVGVITREWDAEGFREIAPGWFGGSTLSAVISEALGIPPDLPVVVQGETGTGKECAARAIHLAGRRDGELVAVNCAALSEKLVESELFGHKKGAFTGADKANLGYFRAANHGTLFLDEIQELPLAFQSKFLRAIERREVVPVGESTPIAIDIRIIVATQEPLTKLVREGRFRPDLQARIEGTTVELPPLRDRREDIVPLFRRFIDDVSATPVDLEPRLVEALCTYDWPLNVRELLLLARRLAALHGAKSVLTRDHLPARFSTSVGMESSVPPVALPPAKRTWKPAVDDSEYEALLHALKAHQGNVSRAAAAIGIHRSRAYRLLAAHPEYGGANE